MEIIIWDICNGSVKKMRDSTAILRKRIRNFAQRISFHKAFPSRLIAEILYLSSSFGSERKKCIIGLLKSQNRDSIPTWSNKKQIKEILYARAFYAIEYNEYFLYRFYQLKDAERRKYVGIYELGCYYKMLDQLGRPEIFNHKEKTYEVFRVFFGREQVCIRTHEEEQAFVSFVDRHPSCILKPTNWLGGHGIQIIRLSETMTPKDAWEKFRQCCPFVLEELIEQAQEMGTFYPDAVNTIRYNTFFYAGKLTRMQAVLRTGRGGSYVDNASSGGIYALVDTETGKILGPARSDLNELFERHPDTGVRFEGNYIPRWNELNDLLEKVVRVVPEQKQVGWDFALSKNGWVMVEGNTNPALQSFDFDHGLRELITDTFGMVIPIWK